MADDVILSAAVGVGDTIAADEISSKKYQRIKLVYGADGVNSGDVALANGLPIQPATGASFAVTGTFFQATQPISGTVAVTGTFWQATQPVSLAILPALVAGTAVIGHVIVDASSAVIGHVIADSGSTTVVTGNVTVVQATGTNLHTVLDSGTLTTLSTLTTITNVVHVDDNAGSLTVDAPVGTPAFVRLSDGATAIATLPVSLASLPSLVAGTAVIGHVIVDASSAVIGHVIVDSGAITATLSAETTKVIGTVNIAAAQTVGLAAGVAEIGNVKNSGTFVVQATLTAETTKVIGTINIAAAQTLATVTTVSTVTVVSAVTAITNALPVGANVIGKVSIDQATPGTTNAVQSIPGTSGGLSTYSFLSTAAVQSANVKASGGQLYSMEFFNLGAAAVFVRVYNKASTDDGSGTPVLRFVIPGNTAGAGVVKYWPDGIALGTGFSFRCTGAVADADTTVLAANVVIGNFEYK